jgi:hypothetical protein
MNKLEIEKKIIEITRITGLLVEEIQWDQEINIESMKTLVDDLQKQSEKLHKLLG